MSNTGRVYFSLRGEFVPADLTAAIGIEPTSSAMAGERKLLPKPVPRCSLWDYSTETVEGEVVDVYEMSSQVVSDLAPYTERIADEVQKRHLMAVPEVVLDISTDEDVSTPILGFETEVIDFLHRVGATIDIDTYRNTPEESEQDAAR
jgi:hypothetical protein